MREKREKKSWNKKICWGGRKIKPEPLAETVEVTTGIRTAKFNRRDRGGGGDGSMGWLLGLLEVRQTEIIPTPRLSFSAIRLHLNSLRVNLRTE